MFQLDLRTRIYLTLCAVFVTSLLVADIIAGKFFVIGGLEVSVGVIPFPITFLLTDVVNEYYGRKGARLLTGIGAAMLVFAFGIIFLARALPTGASSPVPQAAFDGVFGISYKFFAASLIAYLVGQFADINAFHVTKRITASRLLWLRATGSTAISQVVDTAIVNAAALAGILSAGQIVRVAFWSYVYKMTVAVLLTPVLYGIHGLLEKRLGLDPLPPEGADGAPGVLAT